MQEITVYTGDQYPIKATLFSPAERNGKLLLVNSATGVRQQMYFAFAKHAADQGFTVITYDYRGIGLSKPLRLKGFDATMRTWGTLDYKAVTDYILQHYPDCRLFGLGHSVGALLLGMNGNSKAFEKFVFIGTQKAFVGNLNFKTKFLGYAGLGLLQPFTTLLWGYFPGHLFGLGERLPVGVSRDWRSLVLHKKSTNYLLENIEKNHSKALTQDVLVVRAEDDSWLTEKGVTSLMHETYPNMRPVYRVVHPKESEKGKIGHVNFFRSYNRKLWTIILDYII